MSVAPEDKVAPQVTVTGVLVPTSDDCMTSEPIPIFLLPKGKSQEVSQPVLLPSSQDGGVSSPTNGEDTSPVHQPTNVDQPLSDRASDQVAVTHHRLGSTQTLSATPLYSHQRQSAQASSSCLVPRPHQRQSGLASRPLPLSDGHPRNPMSCPMVPTRSHCLSTSTTSGPPHCLWTGLQKGQRILGRANQGRGRGSGRWAAVQCSCDLRYKAERL